ncbi:MAG: ABC transporter ATP-binding protein [Anaerolineaceae bacterium]|nr:ABC transporter ATP-binding protein [Anaerolineaceae bacterium]
MEEMVILANKLVKQFKNDRSVVTAVDHVSLAVAAGETYGLIGPDGAGKTTTIRVILGLLSRTAGESSVLGFDSMRATYKIREGTGYIAQSNVLPPDLSVMENMHFFADIHGVDRETQKKSIPELLAFTGLGAFTSRLAGKLSGGMKKKLALACSLIHEPKVVFLDEPTLGVDPVSRREFWNLLGNLSAEKGLTIFMSTPYMDEAERCTQVGLITNGEMIASGTPAEIKGMLPGHLLEFTPAPFKAAYQLCSTLPGVLEVQSYGQKLHLFVDEVPVRKPQIETALAAQGIQHDDLRQVEVRMEEAYISLVNRHNSSLLETAQAA